MQICTRKKMERKKGKKSVRDLFFKLHFAWKKRELCDVRGSGGGGSSPPDPTAPRRAVVWQCLFFSFSYFSCSLSARGNYTHRRYTAPPSPAYLNARNIHHHHPLNHHHSLPTLLSRPLTRAYCCTVYFGNNANGDCGTMGSGAGRGDSFLKVSFWFWRWQIHTVLSSVVRRRPHTHTHTNTVPLLIQSHRILCVCVYIYICICFACAQNDAFSSLLAFTPHNHRVTGERGWNFIFLPARRFSIRR